MKDEKSNLIQLKRLLHKTRSGELVQTTLMENNIHPVEEILKLMPDLPVEMRLEVWLELLSFCEEKYG